MKKVLCIAIMALMTVSAVRAEEAAGEPGNLGIGYQGIFFGDMINALSLRWAPAPLGGQIEFGEGGAALSVPGSPDVDLEIIMLKGKMYYTIIQRENSAFYAGASLGYYMFELDPGGGSMDINGFSIAPLIGTEWRFQGLPELGLNFEISYEFNDFTLDTGGGDVDIGLRGITVSTGIHYYF